MSWSHFQRAVYTVRIGGWSLGPLRLGGGRYAVGPMTTLRAMAWLEAVQSIGAAARDSLLAGVLERLPLTHLWLLGPVMVNDPIAPRHWARVTPPQLMAIAEAWGRANDVPYITEKMSPQPGGRALGLEVMLWSIVKASGGAYTVRDLLELPFQEVLAIADAAEDAARVAEDGPHLTDEQMALAGALQAGGVMVS